MAYTFARVSAVARLKREDYRIEGKRARLRLLEKGNKEKLVWLHHEVEQFVNAWLAILHIEDGKPLFQTLGKTHRLTGEAMSATIPSGEPSSPCSCRTAALWKRRRTGRTTLIRARPSSTTGARIWPRLTKSVEGLRLSDRHRPDGWLQHQGTPSHRMGLFIPNKPIVAGEKYKPRCRHRSRVSFGHLAHASLSQCHFSTSLKTVPQPSAPPGPPS